jgi:hypothetical protein
MASDDATVALKAPWEGVRSRMIREPEDLPVLVKNILEEEILFAGVRAK